jgi:hypothetical protein
MTAVGLDEDLTRLRREHNKEFGGGQSREIIRFETCPRCGALRDVPCDWSRDRLDPGERADRQAEGRSHYERMMKAQGVDPSRWAGILARARRRRRTTMETKPVRRDAWREVAARVPCPYCHAAKAEPCEDRHGEPCAGYVHSQRTELAEDRHRRKEAWREKRRRARLAEPPPLFPPDAPGFRELLDGNEGAA